MKNQTIKIIAMLFIVLVTMNLVSAEFWACFNKKDVVNFCIAEDRTCGRTLCKYCMGSYNEAGDCFYQGSWNLCNSGSEDCFDFQGNANIDIEPPIITIINPVNNQIYNRRSILLGVNLNEISDLYYLDLIDGRGRWIKVCQECSNSSKERSFKEGWNNLTIQAEDLAGNSAYKNVSFFVDSKKPRIHRTEPRNRFVAGEFSVQYSEENLAEIRIYYGNSETGMRNAILSGCNSGDKQYCDINLNLGDYNGEDIEYWFNVKDNAGNSALSKKTKLTVDTVFPTYQLTYNVIGKYVYVKLNVAEINFDSVEYRDVLDANSKYKTLCSSLKNWVCEKKITLKAGSHKLNFQIMDKAGNTVSAETGIFGII